MDLKKIDFEKTVKSKAFKYTVWTVVGLILLLLSFKAGEMVGFRKANFSYRWGDSYHRNFAGPRGGFMRGMMDDFRGRDYLDAHGVFGQVLKVDGQVVAIQGRDGIEKSVLVSDSTTIRKFTEDIRVTDLRPDDFVSVIGEPNEAGQVVAKFIRVMPAPPTDGNLPPAPQPDFGGVPGLDGQGR